MISSMPARVLLVCTANICRSPTAERLLTAGLGPEIEVFSRGVCAPTGAGMCPISENWLLSRGALSAGSPARAVHRSRQLTSADVAESGLVLTATTAHRSEVVLIRPRAESRTFTLLEAARIMRSRSFRAMEPPPDSAAPADRLAWLVSALTACRAEDPDPAPGPASRFVRRAPVTSAADSIPDPHNGGKHWQALAALETSVTALSSALTSCG
jgi:protein-tyrosine phosphatase